MDNEVDEILEQFSQIKHKILFFFMPESIVFQKPKRNEDPDLVTLKSISPLFYWCSAHEFPDFDKEYKYLIQYQLYSIESNTIVPHELFQKWCKTKHEIRDGILSFLELWDDHKRILLNTILNKDNIEFKNNNQIQDFSTFANFVGKSIFDLKYFYIKQAAANMNFDILQKEFWKTIAMNSSDNIFEKKIQNPLPEESASKRKKRKNTKPIIKKKKCKKNQ